MPKIVLHVDDDPEDRELVHEAIKSIDSSFIVHEPKADRMRLNF